MRAQWTTLPAGRLDHERIWGAAAAAKAMELGRPLFVVEFETYDAHSTGNARLLRHGGRALRAEPDEAGRTWRVGIEPVLAALDETHSVSPSQLDMFECS